MLAYRIYFKDLSDRITSPPVEAFGSADDAMAAARRALDNSSFSFVEVWRGAEMLARFARPLPSP